MMIGLVWGREIIGIEPLVHTGSAEIAEIVGRLPGEKDDRQEND